MKCYEESNKLFDNNFVHFLHCIMSYANCDADIKSDVVSMLKTEIKITGKYHFDKIDNCNNKINKYEITFDSPRSLRQLGLLVLDKTEPGTTVFHFENNSGIKTHGRFIKARY